MKNFLPLLLLLLFSITAQGQRYLSIVQTRKMQTAVFQEGDLVEVKVRQGGESVLTKGTIVRVHDVGFYVDNHWVPVDSVQQIAKTIKLTKRLVGVGMLAGGSLLLAAIPNKATSHLGYVQYIGGMTMTGNGLIQTILYTLRKQKRYTIDGRCKIMIMNEEPIAFQVKTR